MTWWAFADKLVTDYRRRGARDPREATIPTDWLQKQAPSGRRCRRACFARRSAEEVRRSGRFYR